MAALHITLEGGRLVGDMDGRGTQALVAMSEAEFTGLSVSASSSSTAA